jgi:signal transduction histidine kinase
MERIWLQSGAREGRFVPPMESTSPTDTRELLSRLLSKANRGAARVDFFRNMSQILLYFSGCDSLELLLKEDDYRYRCQVLRGEDGAASFDRLPLRPESAEDFAKVEQEAAIESLKSDVPQGRFSPSANGTLWTGGFCSGQDFRSVALIPLEVGVEKIGLLRLQSRQADFFSSANIETFEEMARTLAMTLMYQRAHWATRERVKELTCLYAISQLADRADQPREQLLLQIVERLPPAWQYPEICSARISLDDAIFDSKGFRFGPSRQTADIIVGEQRRGAVEIYYAQPRPELDEGPFLKEERSLINEVAHQVGQIVRRRQVEDERVKLEAQLRHADRLATIGQLAAGVAHELNEPLGAILGFSQLATKSPRLPKQAAQDIDRITKAALHAREVVRKLKIFGRQAPPQRAQVRLNRLVEEGLEFVRPRCDAESVRLALQLAPDLPLITADTSQLHQVLINLIVNAVQAMPTGGTITIRTETRHGSVILAVEDTGVGMPEHVVQNIFRPFFTTKEVGKGTGLGLCVVHGIVTSHGGTIAVDSKEGRGTRFEIRLPVAASMQQQEHESHDASRTEGTHSCRR